MSLVDMQKTTKLHGASQRVAAPGGATNPGAANIHSKCNPRLERYQGIDQERDGDQQNADPRLREETLRRIDMWSVNRHVSQKARLFAGALEASAFRRRFVHLCVMRLGCRLL